ncbi:MAG TPA: hypothetical protein VK427_04685, partial [Kofleriaceae bacterium]|nr:hypothetical protein [Kofleriaceae bacterium]
VDEPRTQPFDEAAFIAALRARRVVATTGPWLDVEVAATKGAPTVGPGASLRAKRSVYVDVTLAQAGFVKAEQIKIWLGTPAGPTLVHAAPPPRVQVELELGPDDTWLAITADGDTPMPKEITGTYQQDRWKRPGVTPFALAAAVLIDVDGDGRWKRGEADVVLP